ncbi:imelysin family protein [Reinekea thalattae]|uniref:imelysin family protein n=1 Tax=Reinekea thalattae TaxID=2593301 RepID=UPI00164FD282|nr:imelysin family protein [Reinekea thalattae]
MNKTFFLILVLGLLTACDSTETSSQSQPVDDAHGEPSSEVSDSPTVTTASFTDSANYFRQSAIASVLETQTQCNLLFEDIATFVSDASASHQLNAQETFGLCLESWRRSELYFQKPFSYSEIKPFHELIDLIDTRPFLPGYIGGIPEYPYSGLVHELEIPLNESTLRRQHRLMDEESPSLGFPVIEFLLWKAPIEGNWTLRGDESDVNVERRFNYLAVAASVLQEQINQAVIRWQSEQFNELPERAQLNLVLQSFQRYVMIDLLQFMFEETALSDPEWHHYALLSGSGRNYPVGMLQSVQSFVGQPGDSNAFTDWVNSIAALSFSADELQQSVADSIAATEQLPENYPLDTEASEQWQLARSSVAAVSVYFVQLMRQFDTSLLLE